MKKVTYLMVLAAAVLLASCGKSRTPEVEAAAKAASEGIFGDAGEELVCLMDDYATAQMEPDAQKREKKEEEAIQKLNTFYYQMEGTELPTEVADGVPLKLVKPFTVVTYDEALKFLRVEVQVELTTDRPAYNGWSEANYLTTYAPTMVLVDADGNRIVSSTLSGPVLNDYTQLVATGTHETLKGSIQMSGKHIYNRLAARKIVIQWNKPFGPSR